MCGPGEGRVCHPEQGPVLFSVQGVFPQGMLNSKSFHVKTRCQPFLRGGDERQRSSGNVDLVLTWQSVSMSISVFHLDYGDENFHLKKR